MFVRLFLVIQINAEGLCLCYQRHYGVNASFRVEGKLSGALAKSVVGIGFAAYGSKECTHGCHGGRLS